MRSANNLTTANPELTRNYSRQSPKDDIETTRNEAVKHMPVADNRYHHLDPASVLFLQYVLGHGGTYSIWETPQIWAPGMRDAARRIDLRARCLSHLPDELRHSASDPTDAGYLRLNRIIDQAVLRMSQYMLVLRVGPVGMKGKAMSKSLDPALIASIAYNYLPKFAATAAVKLWSRSDSIGLEKFFSCLSASDFANEKPYVRDRFDVELKRMHRLKSRGLWQDAFTLPDSRMTTAVSVDIPGPAKNSEPDPYLPLPDEYVGQMGHSCFWIVENLGPPLIQLLKKMTPIWEQALASTQAMTDKKLARLIEPVIRNFVFVDASGRKIRKPPFQLTKRGRAQRPAGIPFTWPLKHIHEVFDLVSLVQAAHMFAVLMSLGPRVSELMTFDPAGVSIKKDGLPYQDGRTYKLSENPAGEKRDWVLPDFAVCCIVQQQVLVKTAGRLCSPKLATPPSSVQCGKHLWGNIGTGILDRREPVDQLAVNDTLRGLAKSLGLTTSPGGQPLTSHRFRKTLARIAALAILEAPRVLMQVFGHKDIAMTMHYILTDKALRAEIDTVLRELRVMRAKEVVDKMYAAELASETGTSVAETDSPAQGTFGGYGGLAAPKVASAIRDERTSHLRTGAEFNASDSYELAETLTMNGKHWSSVRPGILCTKLPGQKAPCTSGMGEPNRTRCSSKCESRLEEGWLRTDVELCIREARDNYVRAGAEGADLVQSHWAKQVIENLNRFDDIREKWMEDPVVKEIRDADDSRSTELSE